MGLSVAFTAALVVWLVLWSFGIKAIDGFILAATLMFVAIGTKMVSRFLPDARP